MAKTRRFRKLAEIEAIDDRIALKAQPPVTRKSDGAAHWREPGARGENLAAFEFPTFLLGRLTGLIKRSLMTAYTQPFGLAIPEWRVFAALAAAGAGGLNEICGQLTMDRGQVSRTLPALVAKGLVTQGRIRRPGPLKRGESAYQTRFTVTAAGRALFRQALPVAQRHQMVLLAALDGNERAALYQSLLKMVAAAERFESLQDSGANPRRVAAQNRLNPTSQTSLDSP